MPVLILYIQHGSQEPFCILHSARFNFSKETGAFTKPVAFLLFYVLTLMRCTSGDMFRLAEDSFETVGNALSPLEPWLEDGQGKKESRTRLMFCLAAKDTYHPPYFKDIKAGSRSVYGSAKKREDFGDAAKIAIALRSMARCMLTNDKPAHFCHILSAKRGRIYDYVLPPDDSYLKLNDAGNGMLLHEKLHSLFEYGDILLVPLPNQYFDRNGRPTATLQSQLDEYPTAFQVILHGKYNDSLLSIPSVPACLDFEINPPDKRFNYTTDVQSDVLLPPQWLINYKFSTSLTVAYGDKGDISGFEAVARQYHRKEEAIYDECGSQASTRGSASRQGSDTGGDGDGGGGGGDGGGDEDSEEDAGPGNNGERRDDSAGPQMSTYPTTPTPRNPSGFSVRLTKDAKENEPIQNEESKEKLAKWLSSQKESAFKPLTHLSILDPLRL